jgi:hypothetical protein
MPLRCAYQAPGLRTEVVWSDSMDRQLLRKSWSTVYSAQRHKEATVFKVKLFSSDFNV